MMELTSKQPEQNPYASMFWNMIEEAQSVGASDIHIQPEREGVDIRFRIYGELSRWKKISEIHQSAFLQEAKRLSQCSLATNGKPQDARMAISRLKLDIRVNLIPSLYGEKLCLRLLDQSRSFLLDQVGLDGGSLAAMKRALSHSTGVILLTGPTGSGKTTLLYSVLAELDRAALNVVTIEDPIEYTFAGITQVQVSPKLTFADSLRAMLRQDPDVILLGEIRDPVTAELCFQAAATGHLVLSTLHANGAREVIRRLQGLNVNPDVVRSCLKFSSAQRLLPRLCLKCALVLDENDRNSNEMKRLFETREIGPAGVFRKRNMAGCKSCRKGFVGRLPIFEYIEWSNESQGVELTNSGQGLRSKAIELARAGEVDVYDALASE